MLKIHSYLSKATCKAYIGFANAARYTRGRVRDKLLEKDGSFFTEHALAIVITVVIAAIIILAVVALFKDRIFPQLEDKVDEFFNVS